MRVTSGRAEEYSVIELDWRDGHADSGRRALQALLNQAAGYVGLLRAAATGGPRATLGRVRGTGPGCSFGAVVSALQQAFPRQLQAPFEGSPNVSGASIEPAVAGLTYRDDGFLLLRFAQGTRDLPLHTHDESERLIYVLEGRGTFHVAANSWADLDPAAIRHVPIRERDVLMFARGTIHTFSTDAEPLLLLSYHAPFVALDDPRQYTIRGAPILPATLVDCSASRPACDPAWTRLV